MRVEVGFKLRRSIPSASPGRPCSPALTSRCFPFPCVLPSPPSQLRSSRAPSWYLNPPRSFLPPPVPRSHLAPMFPLALLVPPRSSLAPCVPSAVHTRPSRVLSRGLTGISWPPPSSRFPSWLPWFLLVFLPSLPLITGFFFQPQARLHERATRLWRN